MFSERSTSSGVDKQSGILLIIQVQLERILTRLSSTHEKLGQLHSLGVQLAVEF